MPTILSKPSAIAALLISVLTLAACGESSQEKAMASVCSSRSDISKQITKLQGLTISSSFVTEAKAGVEAIGKDLSNIKSQQPKLEPARKEQVEAATKAFTTEFNAIAASTASSVVGSLGANAEAALKNSSTQIKAALIKLGNAYKTALGPISCP